MNFKTTAEIKIPKQLIDQIIGQDEAVNIIKKAAKQHRHVLLIGEPGTGKSLTGQALAELLPKKDLEDVLSFQNVIDDNAPIIKSVPRGRGIDLVNKARIQAMGAMKSQNLVFFVLVILAILTPWWVRTEYGDIMAAASLIGSMIFLASFVLFMNINRRTKVSAKVPKLLVDNSKIKKAPFYDGTGAHAGALLGDCLHDPLQCYSSVMKINEVHQTTKGGLVQIQETDITTKADNLLKKHKADQIRQKDYEATFTNKGEMQVLGETNDVAEPVDVLSVNRHPNTHKHLIKITTESGNELIVTPEHKVAVKRFGKIVYKEAMKLTKFDNVIALQTI